MISKKSYVALLGTILFSSIIYANPEQNTLKTYAQQQLVKQGLSIFASLTVEGINRYRENYCAPTPKEQAELDLRASEIKLAKAQEENIKADLFSKRLSDLLLFCKQTSVNGEISPECKELLLRYQRRLQELGQDLPELEKKG